MGVTAGESEEPLIDIAVTPFFVDVKVEQSVAQKLLKGIPRSHTAIAS